MSITAPADAVRNNQDVKPNYHSQHELLKREETSSQHYTTKNRLMQLDGLASRPRLSRSPTDHIPISRPDEDFPKSESAFSVYHKMKNLNENTRVDEYATLPWHLNRRNSKVVVRSKKRDVNGKIILKKSNLHYTSDITPKRVTSSGVHLPGSVPKQRTSEESSQLWRAVGGIVLDLVGNQTPDLPRL